MSATARARETVVGAPPVPAGYARVATSHFELVARQDVVGSMRAVLEAHGSLYDWAGALPQSRGLRGRAPVHVAPLPGLDVVVAVRHAWHGGMLAPLTGDRFRTPTRAPVELANSLRLQALDVRTTEMLAYVLYPAGPVLRRVDVASRLIAHAVDFGAVLSARPPEVALLDATRAVIGLLVQLARHRVRHPDLNVKNILLARDTADALHAHVIDVDVVRFEAAESAATVMDANLRRLVRSIRKGRAEVGAGIAEDVITALQQQSRSAMVEASA